VGQASRATRNVGDTTWCGRATCQVRDPALLAFQRFRDGRCGVLVYLATTYDRLRPCSRISGLTDVHYWDVVSSTKWSCPRLAWRCTGEWAGGFESHREGRRGLWGPIEGPVTATRAMGRGRRPACHRRWRNESLGDLRRRAPRRHGEHETAGVRSRACDSRIARRPVGTVTTRESLHPLGPRPYSHQPKQRCRETRTPAPDPGPIAAGVPVLTIPSKDEVVPASGSGAVWRARCDDPSSWSR